MRCMTIHRVCAWCLEEIPDEKRRDSRFCSSWCRNTAHRASPCIYCGMPAQERDHVIARRQREVVALRWGELAAAEANITVPSCGECNRIAGSRLFRGVSAKRRFIHSELRRKYAKVLAYCDYTQAEIDEMEGWLKQTVIAGLEAKRLTRQRLAWPNVYEKANAA